MRNYDDDRLLAYACYILTENGMYAFLDYFAVVAELRGHGTDSLDPAPDQQHSAIEELYREIHRPVYGRLCKPYISKENQ